MWGRKGTAVGQAAFMGHTSLMQPCQKANESPQSMSHQSSLEVSLRIISRKGLLCPTGEGPTVAELLVLSKLTK